MRREIRLYNFILPIWALWLVPQAWLAVLPGNFLIDGLVFFLTLVFLKRADKGAFLKSCLWKLWLCGFAADFAGVLWLLAGFFSAALPDPWGSALEPISHNPFLTPLSFFWTLAAVALSGVCVYLLDRRVLDHIQTLSARERHIIALAMAIATAPWTFFIPVY